MSWTALAKKNSACVVCGEQITKDQDRIRLYGSPTGKIIYKGTETYIGTVPHADCAPENTGTAPHLLWRHVANLVTIIQAEEHNLAPDGKVDPLHLRRFIAALRLAKGHRHLMPVRGDNDAALTLSPGFYQAFVWILKRTEIGGSWWRPWHVMKNEPWRPEPKTDAPPIPSPEDKDAAQRAFAERQRQQVAESCARHKAAGTKPRPAF